MNANLLNWSVIVTLSCFVATSCSDDSKTVSSTQHQTLTATPHIEKGKAAEPFRGFDVVGQRFSATLLGLGRDVQIGMSAEASFIPSVGANADDWTYEMSPAVVTRGDEKLVVETTGARLDGSTLRIYSKNMDALFTHLPEGLKRDWVLKTRPNGSGLVRVSVPTRGARHEVVGNELHAMVDGKYAFGWRKLHVTDAGGKILEARFVTDESGWGIEFNDTNAAYPVFIDPVASTPAWTVTGDPLNGLSRFGFGVSDAGDVNGDGFDDVLVGQSLYTSDAATQNYEGRVLMYLGNVLGLSNTATWTFESDTAFAQLGGAIRGVGDINGDGFDDIAIGHELFAGSAGSLAGRVLVFFGQASGLPAVPGWVAEGSAANQRFGSALSPGGDLNCDDKPDLVVGSRYANANNGNVWVYYGDGTTFNPTPWTYAGTGNTVGAGASVSGGGNINGDTITVGLDTFDCDDLVVGEPGYDLPGLTNQGRVLVFHGAAAGLGVAPNATFTSNQNQAALGTRVALVNDFDGDGFDDVAGAAALYETSAALTDEGGVFIALGSATGLQATLPVITAGVAGAQFGTALYRAGDVNGDGFSAVVVGSSSYSNGETLEGAAYLIEGTATGPVISWSYESNIATAKLGYAAAGGGDINGDGFSDFFITALDYPDSGTGVAVGAVFGFYGRVDCQIGGSFFDQGEVNPANGCEVCNVTLSTTAWSSISNGTACNDGDACTLTDTCQAGVCTPTTTTTCSDGNQCTADSCNPATGLCEFDAVATEGAACTIIGPACVTTSCQAGVCAPASVAGCLISNTCYPDGAVNPANTCQVCDAASDQTDWSSVAAATACNDGLFCTTGDTCDGAGTCGGAPLDCSSAATECFSGTACDEANDICIPAIPEPQGTACGGDLCTNNGMCNGGGICTGMAVSCAQFDTECTVGVCSLADGSCSAVNRLDGTGCDDGVACTSGDTCTTGVCGGTAVDCSGLDSACVVGVCDATTGACGTAPVNEGGACDDADACTDTDTCTAGACAGVAVVCDDGNSCSGDTCDSATGCVFTTLPDGSACTDDALTCTTDACNAGVCENTLATGCLITNTCVADGDLDPNASCRICDSASDTTDYSNAAVGTACPLTACSDDGLSVLAGACDALGTCTPEVTGAIDCAPYRCDAAACQTACVDNADCQDGFECRNNECLEPVGEDMGNDTGDAGSDVGDAGSDTGDDAGNDTGDAGADMGVADMAADADADASGPTSELKGSGCACNSADGAPTDMSWMIAVLGFLAISRKRRR